MRLSLGSSVSPCLVAALLGLALSPLAARAQDDQPSLGDLARNLRREKAQQQLDQAQPQPEPPLIDNDNLAQAMEDVKKLKDANKLVFSIDPSGRGFRVSSPDVSCSLAFNGRASSLLVKPVLVEDLPLADLLKLDGPAFIEDNTLQLEMMNGTDWELREVTVGLTLERKPGENAEIAARARVIPAAEGNAAVTVERRSDMTLLYHLKTTAKPFSTTTFRENIGITPAADEDWRWSIVGAKGIRPQQSEPLPAGTVPPESLQPAVPMALPTAAPTAPAAPQSAAQNPDLQPIPPRASEVPAAAPPAPDKQPKPTIPTNPDQR